MDQNWETGDFNTWIEHKYHWQAFGVMFNREDLKRMIPGGVPERTIAKQTVGQDWFDNPMHGSDKSSPINHSRPKGGRPPSPIWPDWIAELSHYLHFQGIPATNLTADRLVEEIADRLVAAGKEPPARSTVRPAALAVLARLRDVEN